MKQILHNEISLYLHILHKQRSVFVLSEFFGSRKYMFCIITFNIHGEYTYLLPKGTRMSNSMSTKGCLKDERLFWGHHVDAESHSRLLLPTPSLSLKYIFHPYIFPQVQTNVNFTETHVL
jgi:hypothetical protein